MQIPFSPWLFMRVHNSSCCRFFHSAFYAMVPAAPARRQRSLRLRRSFYSAATPHTPAPRPPGWIALVRFLPACTAPACLPAVRALRAVRWFCTPAFHAAAWMRFLVLPNFCLLRPRAHLPPAFLPARAFWFLHVTACHHSTTTTPSPAHALLLVTICACTILHFLLIQFHATPHTPRLLGPPHHYALPAFPAGWFGSTQTSTGSSHTLLYLGSTTCTTFGPRTLCTTLCLPCVLLHCTLCYHPARTRYPALHMRDY